LTGFYHGEFATVNGRILDTACHSEETQAFSSFLRQPAIETRTGGKTDPSLCAE
jgi:hypothetical protein